MTGRSPAGFDWDDGSPPESGLSREERDYLWKQAELNDVSGPDRGLLHRVLEALDAAEQELVELLEWKREQIGLCYPHRLEKAEQRAREWHQTAIERAEALEKAEARAERLAEALRRARAYVEEPGEPGTILETTEASARMAVALLAEIDAALAQHERERA